MQLAGKARKQLLEEINITPLTDVFLVLLIIMIVVAPMLKISRNDIKMPQVEGGEPVEARKLVVEITEAGAFFVDGAMTAENGLVDAFRAKVAEYDEKSLVVRADRKTKESQVIKVFTAVQDAGFTSMTVAVENLPPARQDQLKEKAKEGAPS
jgi:biopolymer transport protein ExbD/biopolymer transport protein TolR